MPRRIKPTRERQKDGRILWRARIMVEGERVHLGMFESQADAQDVIDLAVYERDRRPSGLTVASWGKRWLKERSARAEENGRSFHREVERWNARIAHAPFANRELKRLKQRDVRAWVYDMDRTVSERTGRRLSRNSVMNLLRLLSTSLSDAVEAGKLKENPCLGVRVPKRPEAKEKWTFLSEDEIDAVWNLPDEPKVVFAFAIHTGLRAGEMWGLRWCDVNMGGREISVRRNRNAPTKSGQVRHIPMLPEVHRALRLWQDVAPGLGEALVFPAKHGRCHVQGYDGQWAKQWRKRVTDRTVPKRPTFHDLRHTCASHLLMGTWTERPLRLEEVQRWLGHSSITVTERYAHLAPDSLHAAVFGDSGRRASKEGR